MNNDSATPISKYLASMDRRHSLLTGAALPCTPFSSSVIRGNLNFDDDTFLGNDSLLHMPSPPFRRNNTSTNSSNAASFLSDMGFDQPPSRKRKSFYDDDSEKIRKKSDDMERLLRQTQIDLIDARSIATNMEHQKNLIETQYKEKLINAEQAQSFALMQMQQLEEKVKDLEAKNEKLEKRGTEVSESLHSRTTAHSDLVAQLENRIVCLQNENGNMKSKYEEEMEIQNEKIKTLSDQLQETERCAEKWVCDSQSARDQLVMVQAQLEKCQNQLKETHARLIQAESLKSKYDEAVTSNNFTSEAVKKYENLYIDEQLKNRKLEIELARTQENNKILRSTVSSEMILKEEIASLKKHLSYMEGQVKEKVACDEERKMLHRELEEWKSIAVKLNLRSNNPASLGACLRQYQNDTLELKHEINTLNLELKSKVNIITKLESEKTKLTDELRQFKTTSEKSELDLKRLVKKMTLITKDRDSLKGLKESYEQEFGGQCPKAVENRNQELEEIIAGYEALMQNDPTLFKRPCSECEEANLRLQALESELEKSRSEVKRQAQSLADNQDQLIKLEGFDADLSYKILSFGKNPSMMSIQEKLSEVLSENERLKAELMRLNDDTVIGGANTVSAEEKRVLEEKLKTLERKYEILSDSYDYETTQLQTAIERLFGYHIVLNRDPQSQIKLQNMNSQNPDDVFIFQAGETNDWMLLETPVLDLFRHEIETYLIEGANIPGFLAVVTLKYCEGFPESMTYESATTSQKSQDSSKPLAHHSKAHFPHEEEEKDVPHSEEDEEEDEEDEYQNEDEYTSDRERSQDDYSEEEDNESDGDNKDETWRGNRNHQHNYQDEDPEEQGDEDDDDEDIIMLD